MNNRKILSLFLALAMLIGLFTVPAFAAGEATTVHFYSNDERMEDVYIFVMEPSNGWAQPETGGWPGIQLTKGEDGWYSFELINDPLTFNYFFMFNNGYGDDNKPLQIKWCQANIQEPAKFTTSGLWMTTIASGEATVMDGGDTEIPLTAFATKEEAEEALGLGAEEAPAASGTFELGEMDYTNAGDYEDAQKAWTTDGSLTLEAIQNAKELVLEVELLPTWHVEVGLMCDGTWGTTRVTAENGDAEAMTTIDGTTMTIDLTQVFGYESLADASSVRLHVHYYGDLAVNEWIKNAYLVLEGGEEPPADDPGDEPAAEGEFDLANFTKTLTYDNNFDDLNWAGPSIIEAYEYGIVTGSGAGKFNPGGDLTVQAALAIAAKIHNIYATGNVLSIGGATWAEEAIAYAIDTGLIEEDDALLETQTEVVTRAEAIHLWSKVLQDKDLGAIIDDVAFGDVAEGDAYYDEIMTFAKAGIVTGDADNNFKPDDTFTRGASAALFMKLITGRGDAAPAEPVEEPAEEPAEEVEYAIEGPYMILAEMGDFNVENNATQRGWGGGGVDDIETVVPMEAFINAKYLVLELSAAPTGGLQVIWQGDGDNWGWNETSGVIPNTGTSETTIVIELADTLKNYEAYLTNTMVKIFLGYYSPDIAGLGVTRAFLAVDAE
jgi:hypothetical protein